MAWLYLILAGILEISWAVMLKNTAGFTRLWPSLWVLIMGTASVVLLAFAARQLPVGTAYAVWTGIGTAGTVLFGILYLHEPADMPRLICLALILIGVLGLKYFSVSA